MTIVVFVGPPGSGKTIQMYILSKILNSRGRKTNVLCLKRGFLASLLERILVLLIYRRSSRYPYPLEVLLRGARHKLKKLIPLWYVINTFEIVARLLVLIIMSKLFKRILLVEEYIPAIIADYAYVALRLEMPIRLITNNINVLIRSYLRAYPSKVIVLTASMQELVRRWRKRGRAEHSRIYILVQQMIPNLVSMLAQYPNKDVLVVDTTHKSVLNTSKILLRSIYARW